jgi:hypothetical protein
MKIPSFTPALLIAIGIPFFISGCEAEEPAPANRSPFQSILVRDNTIVATLNKAPRWMISDNTDQSRLSKPNEALILKAGSSLELAERHGSYRVTAELSPRQGLIVEATFDGRSFGDEITTKKYFIPAETKKANKSEMATPRKPSD